MSFPAHINKDEAEQTVGQHCGNVAEISGNHLRRLNLADTAYFAGLLHDAGKCTDEFRNYLEKASHGEVVHRGSIVHTFAAVRFLLNTYHSTPGFMTDPIKDLTVEILSSAIGGHHGLFDCFGEDGNCGFTHRMNKQPAYDDMAMDNFLEEISDKCSIDQLFLSSVKEISSIIKLIMTISGSTDERCFYLSLLTRLITSALIDADRSDTYSFMNNEEHKEGKTLTPGILEALTENFNSRLSELECVTQIQAARSELSDLCFQAASNSGGVFRLNLPTGAGKTLSGLRYEFLERLRFWDETTAWLHRKYGGTSPTLKSIADAAYGVLRTEKEIQKVETDNKILSGAMQRLLLCRLERSPFPADIMRSAVQKCSSLQLYDDDKSQNRNNQLFTTCAIIKKFRYDRFKEEWNMALEPEKKNRNYQFGRLLAVLEKAERDAFDQGEKREPNAMRMQALFVKRPMYASKIIIEQLKSAYYPRLSPGARAYYDKLIGEIMRVISEYPESEIGKPLGEEYLMGYYLQKTSLYTKRNTDNNEPEDNEQ